MTHVQRGQDPALHQPCQLAAWGHGGALPKPMPQGRGLLSEAGVQILSGACIFPSLGPDWGGEKPAGWSPF